MGKDQVQIPELPEGLERLLNSTSDRWERYQKKAQEYMPWRELFGDHTREVLGPSEGEEWAMDTYAHMGPPAYWDMARKQLQRLGGLLQPGQFMMQESEALKRLPTAGKIMSSLDYLPQLAAKRVTGETIAEDPAVDAAMKMYESAMMPIVQNQAALAGLGRSTALTNAIASSQAQTLLPEVTKAQEREERGIDRQMQAELEKVGGILGMEDLRTKRLMGRLGTLGDVNKQLFDQIATAAGGFQDLGSLMTEFKRGKYKDIFEMAGTLRGVEQEQLDAELNEFLRKAGLWESAMGGPLGILPSSIGSRLQKKG